MQRPCRAVHELRETDYGSYKADMRMTAPRRRQRFDAPASRRLQHHPLWVMVSGHEWGARSIMHFSPNRLRSFRSCHVRIPVCSLHGPQKTLVLIVHIKSFSYTFSLILSVLYIQQNPRTSSSTDSEKGIATVPNSPRPTLRFMGEHVYHFHASSALSVLDLDISSRPPSPSRSSIHSSRRTLSRSPSPPHSIRTAASSDTRVASSSIYSSQSWGAITLGSDSSTESDAGSIVSGTSLPPQPLPGASAQRPRRWSTSTSSSFNANAFIIADGFRPVGPVSAGSSSDPPAYSSRPGSLYEESMKYPACLGMPGVRKS